jgi:hypothetical protein
MLTRSSLPTLHFVNSSLVSSYPKLPIELTCQQQVSSERLHNPAVSNTSHVSLQTHMPHPRPNTLRYRPSILNFTAAQIFHDIRHSPSLPSKLTHKNPAPYTSASCTHHSSSSASPRRSRMQGPQAIASSDTYIASGSGYLTHACRRFISAGYMHGSG